MSVKDEVLKNGCIGTFIRAIFNASIKSQLEDKFKKDLKI